MSRDGEASDGASPCESRGLTKRSSGMVELTCEFYHVSFGVDQGMFISSEASA